MIRFTINLLLSLSLSACAVTSGRLENSFSTLEIKAMDGLNLVSKIEAVNKGYGRILFVRKEEGSGLVAIKLEYKNPDNTLLEVMKSEYWKISEVVDVVKY